MAAGVGTLVLFGGHSVQGSQYVYFSDTWAWDGSAWARRSESGPVGRTGAAMAAIVSK
jgi:hypothetical protein